MAGDVSHLGERGRHVWNWAGRNDCVPECYFEPETTEEIRQIVNNARATGKQIRVMGIGCSFSDQAMTSGYMLCLKKFNKVLQVYQSENQIKVEAGITVKDLNEKILPSQGMAISVQGVTANVTIGGAVSTGTHGTGGNYGIMSDYIVAMEIMTSSGEIMEISETSNADLLPAAKLSIGALGIILNLTLQCEPAYNLHQRSYTCDLKDVLEHTTVHVNASDHFQFMWLPYTERAICFHASRTQERPMDRRVSHFRSMVMSCMNYLYIFLLYLCTFLPWLLPRVNRLYYTLVYNDSWEMVARSDRVMVFPEFPKHDSMEYSVSRDQLAVVLLGVRELLASSLGQAHLIVVRFARQDGILISPASGRDVALVGLIQYRAYGKAVAAGPADFSAQFEDLLISVGGRPHWGKEFCRSKHDFAQLYPNWEVFRAVRDMLDPSRMFVNDFLAEIL